MSWTVVKFNKENEVDAVPTTWYNKENNLCYWPPKKISHKAAEYIKNQREPDESWKLFDATFLGLYVSANKKQEKQIEKSTNYKSRFVEIDRTESPLSEKRPGMKKHFLEFKECQKQCLKDINLLHLKIDAISESMASLIKTASNKVINSMSLPNEQLSILKILPMNNSEGLVQMEEWLQTKENRQYLVIELSKIGGPTAKEVVKRVMCRLFENSLSMEYSWEGKKKKKVFKSLSISSVIIDVVRANKYTADCSEFEIIAFIKSWLVRSKERFYNNKMPVEKDTSKKAQTAPNEIQQNQTPNQSNEQQIVE